MKELRVSVYYVNTMGHADNDVIHFLADTEDEALEQIRQLRASYDNVLKRKGDSFFISKFVEIRIEDGAGIL